MLIFGADGPQCKSYTSINFLRNHYRSKFTSLLVRVFGCLLRPSLTQPGLRGEVEQQRDRFSLLGAAVLLCAQSLLRSASWCERRAALRHPTPGRLCKRRTLLLFNTPPWIYKMNCQLQTSQVYI